MQEAGLIFLIWNVRDTTDLLNQELYQIYSRYLSGSYSLKDGDKEYAEYMEALISLFNKHSRHGTVSIANQSVAYIGVVW